MRLPGLDDRRISPQLGEALRARRRFLSGAGFARRNRGSLFQFKQLPATRRRHPPAQALIGIRRLRLLVKRLHRRRERRRAVDQIRLRAVQPVHFRLFLFTRRETARLLLRLKTIDLTDELFAIGVHLSTFRRELLDLLRRRHAHARLGLHRRHVTRHDLLRVLDRAPRRRHFVGFRARRIRRLRGFGCLHAKLLLLLFRREIRGELLRVFALALRILGNALTHERVILLLDL